MNQINEALAQFDSGEQFHDDEWGAILYDIAEGARAYVRDWITCPTCGGDGRLWREAQSGKSCPDCVDGMIPSPEALGRGAKAAAKWEPDYAEAVALAVLLASRRGEEEYADDH